MKTVNTPIIPVKSTFASVVAPHELHKEALCIFTATGFFLDRDTFWKDSVCLPPASKNILDEKGLLLESAPHFQWHHTPREISFNQALEEFAHLFETIVKDQVEEAPVILPLSGGLDSRTQAVALSKLPNTVHAFSYSFQGGYPEHRIAKAIAKQSDFTFSEFAIPQGYLWEVIEELATINGCYSEFTHPRQMAALNKLKKMNGVFSLGHWGDVLFDKAVPDGTTTEQLTDVVLKKIIKPGGRELAQALWQNWSLAGSFDDYLRARVQSLLDDIKIENVNAKVRAFKSLYWAPRWTSTNLSIFSEAHPVHLPYYDDRMCRFICEVPEDYLADRKLQIAYIKQQSPELAKITWQSHRPYNLNTYTKNKAPHNLPYRVFNKLSRELKAVAGEPYIQRNWELQFVGKANEQKLKEYLSLEGLNDLISPALVDSFFNKFLTKNRKAYSHPVSMLLTLALWSQQESNG